VLGGEKDGLCLRRQLLRRLVCFIVGGRGSVMSGADRLEILKVRYASAYQDRYGYWMGPLSAVTMMGALYDGAEGFALHRSEDGHIFWKRENCG